MLLKTFIATLVLCQTLTWTSGFAVEDREKRALAVVSQAVDYVNEDGTVITHKVLMQDQEVQVSTGDGIAAVIDYKQGMLTMRPADEKVCVSILLGDLAAKLPTLDEVKKIMSAGQTKLTAPADRIELQLTQAQTITRVSLSPLSAQLCGTQAPMFLTQVPVGVKPIGWWWRWWPWHWWPRPCPWCWRWPCFYWPWWFYYYRFAFIIMPW